jgi:hypothetical protein
VPDAAPLDPQRKRTTFRGGGDLVIKLIAKPETRAGRRYKRAKKGKKIKKRREKKKRKIILAITTHPPPATLRAPHGLIPGPIASADWQTG